MNRKSANAYDSDDSASDWDTTAAESPTRPHPPPTPFANIREDEDQDGDYATVIPKPRLNLQASEVGHSSSPRTPRSAPPTTPRKDIPKRKDEVFSPPPHLNSFKNALSDYSEVYDPAPNVPPKLYDEKGQIYTVPDTDRSTHQVAVDWDDSDAEEKVLQELRQNMEKERKKQEAKQMESEKEQSIHSFRAADNEAYEPSPNIGRASKSVLEQWVKENNDHATSMPYPKNNGDNINNRPMKPDRHKKNKTRKPAMLPITVEDSYGKKCVFYFEESSHRRLEAEEDDMDAFLPNKIEEIEKLFRRVWREIFSVLRIITSFFVMFVTEFMSLVIHHILQPLVLDSFTALGNYFFKPFMTILFNMIVQPFFALLWNTFNALFLAAGPLVQLLGAVCSKIAIVLQAIQLFHVSFYSQHPSSTIMKRPEIV